jgi:hypothetical protein
MKRYLGSAALFLAVVFFAACGGEASVSDMEDPTDESAADITGGDPANNAVYGLDMSMWEGPLSQYEMDCFWSKGVRHMVIGTQVEQIAREQLEMARRRGMSLDAYVFMHWDSDVRAQVREGFRRVAGYRIGRVWLDVEEAPKAGTSAKAMIDTLQQAVDECRAQTDVACGIYTGNSFWYSWVASTTRFADVPLWYALYDNRPLLSSWQTDHFGGWTAPAGKQWNAYPMCGVTSDQDTIQRLIGPDLVVDRTPAPAPTTVPSAPTDLWPTNFLQWSFDGASDLQYMKMMVGTVPGATSYEIALQSWTGSTWTAYATWSPTSPFVKVCPNPINRIYRFHARAKNAYGFGPWSDWSAFEYGKFTGTPPAGWGAPPTTAPDAGTPPPPPSPDAGTPTTPPDAGTPPPVDAGAAPDSGTPVPDAGTPAPDAGTLGPVGLSPDGNQSFASGAAVKLSCATVPSATEYSFAIDYLSGGAWKAYYTYQPTTDTVTFWPQISATSYRFHVQAKVGGTFGPWSSYATFQVH